jgi:hypothetical protein
MEEGMFIVTDSLFDSNLLNDAPTNRDFSVDPAPSVGGWHVSGCIRDFETWASEEGINYEEAA